jgi:diacylglycerol kinase family enzyme
MEAVIIGNPNSGSAGDEGYLERFAETLRVGGLEVEVLNTERPDHATELAQRPVTGSLSPPGATGRSTRS